MKTIFSIVLLLLTGQGFSQTITREDWENESHDNIKDLVIKEEIRNMFRDEEGKVRYDSAVKYLNGIPAINFTPTGIILANDSIDIRINSAPFNSAQYKLTYDSKTKDLVLINDKVFWGTDMRMPKTKIESVIVKIGDTKITLPEAALANLFEPSLNCYREETEVLCYTQAYVSKDGRRVYIFMSNSDGAAAYDVLFIIKDGKYYGRVVEGVE